jgi:hypothetical protein
MLMTVFLPPVPQDLPELQRRIIAAISEIDRDLLQWVWVEMDCLDVCRVTKGGHIVHLRSMQKNTWRVYLSICGSHVTIFSAIQVYRFNEMCQGIMNNSVYTTIKPTNALYFLGMFINVLMNISKK